MATQLIKWFRGIKIKTEKQINELLKSLRENDKLFGSDPNRRIAIRVLEWVIEDKPENLIEI